MTWGLGSTVGMFIGAIFISLGMMLFLFIGDLAMTPLGHAISYLLFIYGVLMCMVNGVNQGWGSDYYFTIKWPFLGRWPDVPLNWYGRFCTNIRIKAIKLWIKK